MRRLVIGVIIVAVIGGIVLLISSAEQTTNKNLAYQQAASDEFRDQQTVAADQRQLNQINASETATSSQIAYLEKQKQAAQQVENGLGKTIFISYDVATNAYIVTDNIGQQLNSSVYQRVGKQAVFNIEITLWLGSYHPNTVTVNVLAPISGEVLLSATLQKNTASHFDWNSLNPDTAWNAYNSIWMSPILRN